MPQAPTHYPRSLQCTTPHIVVLYFNYKCTRSGNGGAVWPEPRKQPSTALSARRLLTSTLRRLTLLAELCMRSVMSSSKCSSHSPPPPTARVRREINTKPRLRMAGRFGLRGKDLTGRIIPRASFHFVVISIAPCQHRLESPPPRWLKSTRRSRRTVASWKRATLPLAPNPPTTI